MKKGQLVKPFKIWTLTTHNWKKPHKIIDPNVNLRFVDGSGIYDSFGAGFYGPLCNYKESILRGSLSRAFSAEVRAFLRCRGLLLTKYLTRRRMHICCDSRAALAALAKTTTELSLVRGCMQVLGKLSELNKVALVWIPGH